ncbi:hypothetical protein D7V96_25155, partial [bacterium D16-59]
PVFSGGVLPPGKKATVAVTVTKDAATPTDAPSTAPSDTPTDVPSNAPTDAPSTAPTTLGKITELKATKASQLTATFDSAVPEGTTVEVTKGSNKVDGKYTIDGSTVVFDATASFTEGKYTLTATLGDAKESAETDVKASYVADIVIKSEEALTKEIPSATGSAIAGKEAYIYFDVLNQYGESVKDKETVTWTLSVGNETKKVDKSLGRITVKVDKDALSLLNYGSSIYVTGVHTGSGVSVTKSVPVGMAQAVDSIEFAGFIYKDDPTKLVENLPVNFPKDKYVLAYRTFDQQKNPLEVSGKEIEKQELMFIADNALLINPDFNDAGTFTIDGVKYSAVTINPGEFAGKGGEVNITAVATKTGQRTAKNFVVGAAALLQSLSLEAPADTVASGDANVKLSYTAKDVDGKNVTNYETIVRSSNTLNLTAGAGVLKIKEENDGTAGIYWTDDQADNIYAENYSDSATDRFVSLGTTVIGGDNSNSILMLTVSPARHPVAIKYLKLNGDDSNAIVDKMETTIDFKSQDNKYLDQYGKELDGQASNSLGNNILEKYLKYAGDQRIRKIRATVDSNHDLLNLGEKNFATVSGEAITLKVTAKADGNRAKEVNVSYAFVTAPSGTLESSDAWENVDNTKSITYTVVPINEVDDPQISNIGKQQLVTNASSKNNFEAFRTSGSPSYEDKATVNSIASGKKADDSMSNAFSVKGMYKSKTVTIPGDWYEVDTASGSAFAINTTNGNGSSTLSGIRDGELCWGDLYDENSNKGTRIDAVKRLMIKVKKASTGDDADTVTAKVTVSDAPAVPAEIRFQTEWWKWDATDVTLLPNNTEIAGAGLNNPDPHFAVAVYDQYGKGYEESGFANGGWDYPENGKNFLEYTVSDKKESTSEFTHLPNSFKVSGNGSTCNKLKIEGAEIGDTFTLTATVPNYNISKSIKVTVGADQQTFIANKDSKSASWQPTNDLKADADKTFRTGKLGYNK